MFYGIYVKGKLEAEFTGDRLGAQEMNNYISLHKEKIPAMIIVPFTSKEVVPVYVNVMGIKA